MACQTGGPSFLLRTVSRKHMIRLAIQSKGRLNEDSLRLLREIGINIDDAKRKFLGKAADYPLEVLYLRDDDQHRSPFGEPPVVCNYFYHEEITKSAKKKTEKGE